MGNGFQVSASAAQPDNSRTLYALPEAGAIANLFPRLQISQNYPISLYPALTVKPKLPAPAETIKNAVKIENGKTDSGKPEPELWNPLYKLRTGGVPVWAQTMGRGPC